MTAAAVTGALPVVVVTAGGVEVLRDCLNSLEQQPSGIALEVTVVDNATTDGTAGMLRAEFPGLRVLRLERRTSFSAANNIALRTCGGAPAVLLLNPDTIVAPGALQRACATLDAQQRAAVIGVRLVRRDGSFDHAAKRSFPTPLSAVGHFIGSRPRRRLPRALGAYCAPELDERAAGEVDAVNGAFMLVRQAAMEDVGLLDEGYHLYGEDLDWCYRFKRAGWNVWYDGTIDVVHLKGSSSVVERGAARHRPLRTNLAFHHAMGRYYRKHHGGQHPVRDVLIYAALAIKTVVSVGRSAAARRSLR